MDDAKERAREIVREYIEHDLDDSVDGDTEIVMQRPFDGLIDRIAAAISPQESEVEQALKELREMFPTGYVAVRVSGSGFARNPNPIPFGAMVRVNNEQWDAATLSDCMAQVRIWKADMDADSNNQMIAELNDR